jgi:hypothetical protein
MRSGAFRGVQVRSGGHMRAGLSSVCIPVQDKLSNSEEQKTLTVTVT